MQQPIRRVSLNLGISRFALQRHRAHMAAALASTSETAQIAYGKEIGSSLQELIAEANRLRTLAEKRKDYRTALYAVRELTRLIELQAKLSGELEQKHNHLHLHAVSPQEAKRTAEELLLALLSPAEVAALIEELQQRQQQIAESAALQLPSD